MREEGEVGTLDGGGERKGRRGGVVIMNVCRGAAEREPQRAKSKERQMYVYVCMYVCVCVC